MTTLLRYYRDNKLRNELRQEAGLLASFGLQYGFAALHVKWDREVTKKMMPITMEDLVQIAQQAGEESALGQLPAMIADPDQNAVAAEILEAELELKGRRARKMIKELRENGATEMPTDVVTKNCPQVIALKPFEDLFFPPETVELQSASHVFRRVWMSEFEMRELVSVYDYNEDWVEAVINAKEGYPPNYQDPLSDLYNQTGDVEGLHEVVYAYTKRVDPEDGVLSVHCTVFNPKITELVGKESVLDHMAGRYPFVVYQTRERRTQADRYPRRA